VGVRRVSELRQGFGHIMNTTDLEREYLQEMLDLFQTPGVHRTQPLRP
jgi:hypothetical protein